MPTLVFPPHTVHTERQRMDGSQRSVSNRTISCVGLRITLEPDQRQILWSLRGWDSYKRESPGVGHGPQSTTVLTPSERTKDLIENLTEQFCRGDSSLRTTLDNLVSASNVDAETAKAIGEAEANLKSNLEAHGAVMLPTAYDGWPSAKDPLSVAQP